MLQPSNRLRRHEAGGSSSCPVAWHDLPNWNGPRYSALEAFVRQMAGFSTPSNDFAAAQDEDEDVYIDGVQYDDVEEMISDISDDRLCKEYATFMEMVRSARDLLVPPQKGIAVVA